MAVDAELGILFHRLEEGGIHRLDIRDVVCAAAGFKVSRIAASNEQANLIRSLLEPCGTSVVFSDCKFLSVRDSLKGTWSNRCREISASSSDGRWHLFIAKDRHLAEEARVCQKRKDYDSLGALLGIPECCRHFYIQIAEQTRDGDLLPFIFRNTGAARSFDFWTNYGARYFGYSFLAFAPCSFICDQAAGAAKKVWSILSAINREVADMFVTYHKRSIFYSEKSGIFLLDTQPGPANRIYFQTLRMTTDDSPMAEAMQEGNNLEVTSGGDVLIFKDERLLTTAAGEDCALCVFTSQHHSSHNEIPG
jgi:hypothetical protein